ncbi:MAG: hypothetical protein OJF51_000230 [Nitrospira sp.]|jgi:hypothetical protein|nr:MAG: hypothetical protein OJF51_000230 [Nitrospira sp.]
MNGIEYKPELIRDLRFGEFPEKDQRFLPAKIALREAR